MKLNDYLELALKNNLHLKAEWMVSAFSVSETNNTDPYLGKIVSNKLGYSFYNDKMELEIIETPVKRETLFTIKETITEPQRYTKLTSLPEQTTVGKLLANIFLLEIPFRTILPYNNNKFSISSVEETIIPLLNNDPENEKTKDLNKIYISDLILLSKTVSYIVSFSHIFIHATSDKLITEPDNIKEFKKKLLEDPRFKGKLSDPIALQQFEEELIKFDSAYLSDDENAQYFANNTKGRTVIRKTLFLSLGYEGAFKKETKITPVVNSLTEGNTVESLTSVINSARYATASRALYTASGGYNAKSLSRATLGVNIVENDCGTILGTVLKVKKRNKVFLINRYFVSKGALLIDDSVFDQIIGKTVMVRSPAYCKSKKGYCKKCLGEKLGNNEVNSISSQAMSLGNAVMYAMMSAAHTAAKKLVDIDIDDLIT